MNTRRGLGASEGRAAKCEKVGYAVLSFVIPYLEWQTVLCALVIRLRKDKRVVALPRLKKKMKKKP